MCLKIIEGSEIEGRAGRIVFIIKKASWLLFPNALPLSELAENGVSFNM